MTGTPVVAIGPALAGFNIEVPYLIENAVNGYTSNSIVELRRYLFVLLQDLLIEEVDLPKTISEAGRRKAIELFGKEKIKREWKTFFESL